jgi:hypothetical protein
MSKQGKSVDELLQELAEVNWRNGFKPCKLDVDEQETILLDPDNPHDLDRQKNDAAYNVIKDIDFLSLGETKRISITLPEEVWEELERIRGGETKSTFFRHLILNEIKKHKKS